MRIFALLVGINEYAPSVGNLRGAVNDVQHYRDFLTDKFSADQLELQTLINGDASRENIIHGFRDFLCRAGKDDVALFQFAGHGARWKAATEFQEFFPDGFDEGIICADSRKTSDAWDLADKELALLLREVAKKDPHIAVILDCCHSGSGTRSANDVIQLVPRAAHTIQVARPLDSYLDHYYADQLASDANMIPPSSRHMLMAGCDRWGKAFESRDNHRGIFSQTLLEALDRTGMDVCYADLFLRVRSLVRKNAFGQNPQFEANQGFNAYNGFLNRQAFSGGKRFSVHYADWLGWYVEAGAINGLPSGADAKIEMQIFADEKSDDVLGTAVSSAVDLNKSKIEIADFKPDRKMVYTAELTSVPKPQLDVYLSGDASAVESLLQTTENSADVAAEFMWEQESPEGLKYGVLADADGFEVSFLDNDKLIQRVRGTAEVSCEHLIMLLNRIAKWEHALHLQNPAQGVDRSVVDFMMREVGEQGQDQDHLADEVTIDIVKKNGEWSDVTAQFFGQNKTDQRLYLVLVWFDEQFGVHVLYNQPHDRDDEMFRIPMNYENETYKEISFFLGEDEGNLSTQTMKLFVSKEEIDDFVVKQKGFKLGETVDPRGPDQSRGGGFKKKAQEVSWFTKTIKVNLVRQVADVGDADVDLAQGQIKIKSHPALKAGASLLPSNPASRGSKDGFAEGLARYGFDLVNFSTSRGEDQSVLEINNIANRDSLEETPLELELDVSLEEDEYILPVVFDGEHLLLAGDAWKDENNKTQVAINRIPEDRSGARSVFSAFKLYFFKTVCGMKHVNTLAELSSDTDGIISRTTSGLGERIHAAQRILLLVHGQFGDSAMMAKQANEIFGNQDSPAFDLVLGYDYESISTEIQESAQELKNLLKMKGIDENSGKQVTILAHSIGGLVSRWMIEKEGGNAFVNHLIMCGTQNEGSPFGSIALARGAISNLVNIALDILPPIAKGPVAALQKILNKGSLTTTLAQLATNSEFMHELNTADDPCVPYTILAGDVGNYVDTSGDNRFKSLLLKIGASESFNWLFDQDPHDVAVSVDSMRAILDSRSPAPRKTNLACHHLNYLLGDQSQETLQKIQWTRDKSEV